jgi:hypothetical protein
LTKRRKGRAPEGSGVPVGTEYHWYILGHQVVKKLDANDYSTALEGTKFKLAHRRADHEKWNISETTQRRHLIKLLQAEIRKLEQGETIEAATAAPSVERPRPPKAARPSARRDASVRAPERSRPRTTVRKRAGARQSR